MPDIHFWDAFVGAIFGGVVSFFLTVLIEWLRSPNLAFSIEDPVADFQSRGPFASSWRSLRVKVANRAPMRFIGAWLLRVAAEDCCAEITFLRLDGTEYFGRSMTGRWATTPEPIVFFLQQPNGHGVPVVRNPHELRGRVSLFPGETELLDVAVRVSGETEAYGWNTETYFQPNWRNPDRRLDKGRYLVEVAVWSSGRTRRALFRLDNDGPQSAFALAEPTKAQQEVVRRWRFLKRS